MSDRGPRLLLVEDDPPTRAAVSANLAAHGYLVTMTVGGRKSSQRIRVEEWPEGRVGRVP